MSLPPAPLSLFPISAARSLIRKRHPKKLTKSRLACQDIHYLRPIIEQIEAENEEMDDLEEMFVPMRKQVAKAAERAFAAEKGADTTGGEHK